MFQRLLFIAFFVIISIMLIRTFLRFINKARWSSRNQGEIRPNWEVVEPLGDLGKTIKERIKSLLRLKDKFQVNEIAMIFDVAHRALRGEDLGKEALADLVDRAPESIRNKLYQVEGRFSDPTLWLLYAIDRMRNVHPDLNSYELKRMTVFVFHSIFPTDPKPVLPPEQFLTLLSCETPPSIDKRYLHFGDLGSEYLKDKTYISLVENASISLPDGAMLPLIWLLYNTEEQSTNGDFTPVKSILTQYGIRLYPTVVCFLLGFKNRQQPRTTLYSPYLFKIISTWPRSFSEPLFQAALKSGWNDCVEFFPTTDWAHDLTQNFKDSPYGSPT